MLLVLQLRNLAEVLECLMCAGAAGKPISNMASEEGIYQAKQAEGGLP